ncbi:flagellar FliL protein [Sulfurivirga caldicuralii]|uniref:Flagellar protein FliL n=1 Tax=Sulfurivirga caldicuralii TaxID=364032 RepID=A0A1N6FLK0_9GAMM|nr:flagellar basal body-associated FliL family protein [Sulfurivirga caldicuralii]SIN96147.1 flagellar FliL protein [Sulfurivirga caldicuralii]
MAEEEDKKEKSGGGSSTLLLVLIILLFIIVLGLGGLVAWLLLSQNHDKGGDKKEHVAEASAEHGEGGHGDGENPHAKHYSPKFKQFDPPPPDAPPLYFEMKPFVVNFHGEGKAKFLAVTLKLMTYYPQLVGEHGELEHLRPVLRNDITMLLRKQHYSELATDDGPEKLRKEILELVRKDLEKHGIYPDLVEDVLFERFVMQ